MGSPWPHVVTLSSGKVASAALGSLGVEDGAEATVEDWVLAGVSSPMKKVTTAKPTIAAATSNTGTSHCFGPRGGSPWYCCDAPPLSAIVRSAVTHDVGASCGFGDCG